MLQNILNFEGVSLLSKEEQKNLNGGLTNLGYCNAVGYDKYGNKHVMFELSYSQAVALAGSDGHVCCTVQGCANSPWVTLGGTE